jgi:FkbM family methyltransferase
MGLSIAFYRLFLCLPSFRGKARLEGILRGSFFRRQSVIVRQGIRMCLDPWEWTQRDLLAVGCIEPLTTSLFAYLLKDGDVYVDVGCHVGYHTLVARQLVGRTGVVIAIDPQPYNCERTLTNWRVNGFENIRLYVAAAGECPKDVMIAEQPLTDSSRLSLLAETVQNAPRQCTVPVRRLDEIIASESLTRIALLKIDTEGYELEVLRGLGKSLDKVQNIILELLPDSIAKPRTIEIISHLEKAGFDFQTVERQTWDGCNPLPENNLHAYRIRPA